MAVARRALHLVRLVLLGGALSVVWLLLTAESSSAAAGGGDRSLPVLGQVPPLSGSSVPSPANDVRVVSEPVERSVLEAVGVADAALDSAEEASTTVGEGSTTGALRETPVVAPVLDVVDPVVEAVVEPVLTTTKSVSVTVLEAVPSSVGDVTDLVDAEVGGVAAPADAVAPHTPPTGDAMAPVVSGGMDEGLAAGDEPRTAGTAPVAASATPTGVVEATPTAAWLAVADESSSVGAATQRASRGSGLFGPPAAPAPAGSALSGCAPGMSAGGGGQLDLAADRPAVFAAVAQTPSACVARLVPSVPGPSVLPGFSPE
jgi:hypothetical protein